MSDLERDNFSVGIQDPWESSYKEMMQEIADGRGISFEEARNLAQKFYEDHKDLFSPEGALSMLWHLDSWGIDSSTLKVVNPHQLTNIV